jgi:hypothetical protein
MDFRLRRGWLLGCVLALGTVPPALTYATALHADQPALDATRARELFREALALEAAGDYATALSKLQQVATFKTTAQVSFNLGVCHEKLGKLVVALGHYRIALADAEQDPALKKVATEASNAIAELEPKIPSLTIRRGANADDATVKVDGKEVVSAAIGSPMLVDPGTHNVEATASGFEPFKKQVKLGQGEKADLELALKPSSGGNPAPTTAPSASSAPTATASASGDTQPPVPQPGSGGSSGLKAAGWVAIGVGVVGGVLSGVFYSKRSAAISDLNSMCGSDKQSCPESAHSKIDDGKTATLIGNIGLGVGAAGLVTGVILLVVASKGSSEPAPSAPAAARVRVVPSAPGSWAGLTLDTRF